MISKIKENIIRNNNNNQVYNSENLNELLNTLNITNLNKTKINSIFNSVLKNISPTVKEELDLKKITSKILQAITKSALELKYDVVVELGGSSAKKTFLKNDFDCDIFVKFNKSHKMTDNLSSKLKRILNNLSLKIDLKEVHGSRDYFQFEYENTNFEIVPVINIRNLSELENVTDASPLHVKWFLSELKKQPNLNNEIRLAKSFCKAQRIYGAESYIQGFSGHVLDILLSYFGNFLNFLVFFSKQELVYDLKKYDSKKIIFDTKNYYKNFSFKEILKKFNSSKIDSPLIVVDPIFGDRNASSSLSLEKYNLLIKYSRDFLESPDKKFFEKININLDYLLKQKKKFEQKINEKNIDLSKYNVGDNSNNISLKLLLFELELPVGKKDVIGAKVKKIQDYLTSKFLTFDFLIIESDFEYFPKNNSAKIWFYSPDLTLFPYYERKGPKVTSKYHAENFKKKHEDVYEKDGYLYSKIKRDFVDITDLSKKLILDSYIVARCKKIMYCDY